MARPNDEMDILGSDDGDAAPLPGGPASDAAPPEQQPTMSVTPGADGGFEVRFKVAGTPAPAPEAGDLGQGVGSAPPGGPGEAA